MVCWKIKYFSLFLKKWLRRNYWKSDIFCCMKTALYIISYGHTIENFSTSVDFINIKQRTVELILMFLVKQKVICCKHTQYENIPKWRKKTGIFFILIPVQSHISSTRNLLLSKRRRLWHPSQGWHHCSNIVQLKRKRKALSSRSFLTMSMDANHRRRSLIMLMAFCCQTFSLSLGIARFLPEGKFLSSQRGFSHPQMPEGKSVWKIYFL